MIPYGVVACEGDERALTSSAAVGLLGAADFVNRTYSWDGIAINPEDVINQPFSILQRGLRIDEGSSIPAPEVQGDFLTQLLTYQFTVVIEVELLPPTTNFSQYATLLFLENDFNGGQIWLNCGTNLNIGVGWVDWFDDSYVWNSLRDIEEDGFPTTGGIHRVAATRIDAGLSLSVDGGSVLTYTQGGISTFPQDDLPNVASIGGGTYGTDHACFIRYFGLYPPQADSRLPSLSYYPPFLPDTNRGRLFGEGFLFSSSNQTWQLGASLSGMGFVSSKAIENSVALNFAGAGNITSGSTQTGLTAPTPLTGVGRIRVDAHPDTPVAVLAGSGGITATAVVPNPQIISAYVNVGFANRSSAAVPLPGARQVGDVLISQVSLRSGAATVSFSGTGWTFGGQYTDGVITQAWAWRVVDGTETAPTFSWGTTLASAGFALNYRGCKTSAPIGSVAFYNGTGTVDQTFSSPVEQTNSTVLLMGGSTGSYLVAFAQPWSFIGDSAISSTLANGFYQIGTGVAGTLPPRFYNGGNSLPDWLLQTIELVSQYA